MDDTGVELQYQGQSRRKAIKDDIGVKLHIMDDTGVPVELSWAIQG